MNEVKTALLVVGATPRALNALLGELERDVVESPADGSWCMKDVVAHLLVTDRLGTIGRIRRVVEEESPDLVAFDEEAELQKSGLRDLSLVELLSRFSETRRESVAWLRELDERSWLRQGEHSAVGHVTALHLLQHAAYHDANHLRQVAAMLETRFEAGRGSMRRF